MTERGAARRRAPPGWRTRATSRRASTRRARGTSGARTVSERAWGSVREDYSADGDAWASFPHDHARSRAYRWNEDGMAGISDVSRRLCLALALWNGEDPILKERMFGLTNAEGNHGEDVKEYWWYLDRAAHHSWLRWRYHYPQAAFPTSELVEENGPAPSSTPSSSCSTPASSTTTATGSSRSTTRRPTPDDPGADHRSQRRARGGDAPRAAHAVVPQHVVVGRRGRPGPRRAAATAARGVAPGARRLRAGRGRPDGRAARCCSARTRPTRSASSAGRRPRRTPRTASTTTSIAGAPTVNPAGTGTKAAWWYRLASAGRDRRLRLRSGCPGRWAPRRPSTLGWAAFAATMRRARGGGRRVLRRPGPAGRPDADGGAVLRQAFAGHALEQAVLRLRRGRWLDGDPRQPPPPRAPDRPQRRLAPPRRFDILSMPDPWEYPWFAAWDLAFHCVPLAHVDPAFAKYQLLVLLPRVVPAPQRRAARPTSGRSTTSTRRCTPGGAAVWQIDGGRDYDFLASGSSTSCCSTSPGGSTARTRTATTCFGAASSAWTTRRLRPVGACPCRPARAVRRHRLDGPSTPDHARDGRDRSPSATRPTGTW